MRSTTRAFQNGRTDRALIRPFAGIGLGVSDIDERWRTLIRALKDEALRVFVLTNNSYHDRARLEPTHALNSSQLFDEIFESCRLGVRKPERNIYAHVTSKLQVNARIQMLAAAALIAPFYSCIPMKSFSSMISAKI